MPRQGLDTARVVDAAATIADQDGLDAVTIARVAAALGVRPPSLYNHVASREALLRELALRAVGELAVVLREATAGRAGTDALDAMGHAFRAYAHAHPGRYATTVNARTQDDAVWVAATRDTLDAMLAALREWQLEGDEAIHVLRTIRSSLHGFVTLEAAGGFGLPTDLDDSFAWLLRTLAAGLGEPRAPR